MRRETDLQIATSAVSRFRDLLAHTEPRRIVASCDIDGLVSAMMLAAVTPWRVVALIVGSERVAVHPDYASVGALCEDRARLFGVDVFSPTYSNVSNHPLLWGSRRLGGSAEIGGLTKAYDSSIRDASGRLLFLNPSLWASIEASVEDAKRARASRYRYPLGTAQFLLAMLEIVDRSPRLFDREYLPWLVANCDGALDSIRTYPFNVPMWWSAMAAAVGPASLSEQLYQLASEQRPNDFNSVTHRLRSESPRVAEFLTDSWNLRSNDLASAVEVSRWISEISGWPDPFQGGADSVEQWLLLQPERGVLNLSGLPAGGADDVRRNLTGSSCAIHTSFSFFDGVWRLGWLGAASQGSD